METLNKIVKTIQALEKEDQETIIKTLLKSGLSLQKYDNLIVLDQAMKGLNYVVHLAIESVLQFTDILIEIVPDLLIVDIYNNIKTTDKINENNFIDLKNIYGKIIIPKSRIIDSVIYFAGVIGDIDEIKFINRVLPFVKAVIINDYKSSYLLPNGEERQKIQYGYKFQYITNNIWEYDYISNKLIKSFDKLY